MSSNWFDLHGKVVIMTGGAGLLGKEYAHALSQAGAHVVVADIDLEAAKSVAHTLKGAASLPLHVNVTNQASVKAMMQQTFAEFSRIDGLVNNAALDPKFDLANANRHVFTFEDYPLDLWYQALEVNLTGMFLCSQAVAPVMSMQGHGIIVNISSIYGLVGRDQRLYQDERQKELIAYKPVTYTVTKSAVLGFTKYLATYWSGKGIRVNTLTLGGVYNEHDDGFVQRYSWRTPMQRMARKNEYCDALIFLLSEASSYMTGSNLIVDGGWTAW